MIDLRELKERKEEIGKNIADRGMKVDLDLIIELQNQRSLLLQQTEALRKSRNENAKKMKGKMDQNTRTALIEEGKTLKDRISEIEETLKKVEQQYFSLARTIPNYAHPSAPVGALDKDNLEISSWGEPASFTFTPKDHVQLGEQLDIIDFESATRVSGPKFYYLKNEGVLLELALQRYAIDILQKHGFILTITPDIAKEEIVEGIGFNPRGEESNIYTIEGTGTCLVGTAEITLGGYHAQHQFDESDLPLRYAGLSHCFRREAGGAGQYSKGLYRVHQFSKLEMFVYCTPEMSDEIHSQLLSIEEEIFRGLGIPYRIVDTCTGDLGAPAYRKFDIEAWMPGRGESGEYGEVTSTSNCTDYQARRLNVKYKTKEGETRFVHLLNGTAIAVSRAIVAILENFQMSDGSIKIPSALVPYMGITEIRR
ncbi:MAG: serine--tRNA ligase [Sphaerochaetaceae bacterium]|nr:serine--tRNA ligase [Sphaerochaetaceae bacterium]MDC7246758.1 serine--tRNA ligase [Sphaerochaetaceae bacterium]